MGLNGVQPMTAATFTYGIAILSGTTVTKTISMPGAVVGDPVMVVPPPGIPEGVIFCGWMSTDGTASIRVGNMSLLSLTPSSGTWTAVAIKYYN